MTTKRTHFLDNLRVALILLVVFHHTAITYGGSGDWYWREIAFSPEAGISGAVLTFLCAVNQAFFMGLLFLLAGYFTPASLDRKGTRRFLIDRTIRLGIPLLFYAAVVGPVTIGLSQIPNGRPFVGTIKYLWGHKIINIGPAWFIEVLLFFAIGYVVWRSVFPHNISKPLNPPNHRTILLAAVAVGAAAFLIRLAVPTGKSIFGDLQIGYFASYIFLFAAGCIAWRGKWLERFNFRMVAPWIIVTFLTLTVATPLILILGKGGDGFSGGWNIQAFTYAFWEPFVAWGIILFLPWLFRKYFNRGSFLMRRLSERSYSIYILHPPVLVAVSLALRPWGAPPLVKFLTVGFLACVGCFSAATLLLKVPYARRVF